MSILQMMAKVLMGNLSLTIISMAIIPIVYKTYTISHTTIYIDLCAGKILASLFASPFAGSFGFRS